MNRLMRDWMLEGDFGGVEHESGGRRTIQTVTHDGTSEAQMMGGMHPQLMGATGLGEEVHEAGSIGPIFAHLVARYGRFAVLKTDHLAWSVERIGQKG